jgi:CTP synthase (UTP-ammonia lyase)
VTLLVLVGERDPAKAAHAGIESAATLFAREAGRIVPLRWVPTDVVEREGPDRALAGATAVWCVPGSPYASTTGALQAIEWARTGRCPFLGTCGGFQHALMEYGRNVIGLTAMHEELQPNAEHALIVKLSCSLSGGAVAPVIAPEGGWYARLVGTTRRDEEFNCNYGLAPDSEPLFADATLRVEARDEEGHVRVVRLSGHPFFVGSLFQPERRALRGELHPLVRAFLESS